MFIVSNYWHGRFNKLTTEVASLATEHAVDSAVLEEQLKHIREQVQDVILFRINQNTELINHRTKRFEQSISDSNALSKERDESVRFQLKESAEIMLGKLAKLDEQMSEIQQFLAKESTFHMRQMS